MTHIKVLIHTKKDAAEGRRLLENVKPEDIKEAPNLTVGILEGGMKSGKTSLMFCHEHEDGTVSVAQCSALNIEQLYAAVKGAQQRFGDYDTKNS